MIEGGPRSNARHRLTTSWSVVFTALALIGVGAVGAVGCDEDGSTATAVGAGGSSSTGGGGAGASGGSGGGSSPVVSFPPYGTDCTVAEDGSIAALDDEGCSLELDDPVEEPHTVARVECILRDTGSVAYVDVKAYAEDGPGYDQWMDQRGGCSKFGDTEGQCSAGSLEAGPTYAACTLPAAGDIELHLTVDFDTANEQVTVDGVFGGAEPCSVQATEVGSVHGAVVGLRLQGATCWLFAIGAP